MISRPLALPPFPVAPCSLPLPLLLLSLALAWLAAGAGAEPASAQVAGRDSAGPGARAGRPDSAATRLVAPAGAVAGDSAARASRRSVRDSTLFRSASRDSFGEPKIYLAWRAPWGSPRARANLDFTCRDTAAVDTLYLSFEFGKDWPVFCGFFGRIYFHPEANDSLGSHWHFGRDGPNPGAMQIQFEEQDEFPCALPWKRQGIGVVQYVFKPWLGELDMAYAVRPDDGISVSGRTRYCLARVLIRHRRCGMPGARQPVSVEGAEVDVSDGLNPDIVVKKGGERFVSINSPGGAVSKPYERATKPPTWMLPIQPPRKRLVFIPAKHDSTATARPDSTIPARPDSTRR